jgi:hypothetical protein
MSIHYSKLTIAAGVAIAATGVLGVSVNFTDSAAYVGAVQELLGPLGIVAAVLCGLVFARNVGIETGTKKKPVREVVIGFALLAICFGCISAWLFIVSGGDGLSVPGMIGAALTLGFISLTALANKYSGLGRIPPRGIKYLLIAGAFIGGVLPGLLLYFILSLVVSQRYCELTSSKCL